MLFREPVHGVNPVKQYILKITLELPPEPVSREGRCGFTVIKEKMPWNRSGECKLVSVFSFFVRPW